MEAEKQPTRCEQCIVRQLNTLKALDRDQLKCISDSKKTLNFKKGEMVFDEGERLGGVYCVRSGVTKLTKLSDNGRDQIVKIGKKGDVLGQRSVISEQITNLKAVALSDLQVCYIPRSQMENNLTDSAKFSNAILKQMASELKFADDVIVNMAQKSVEQRVAQTLLYLERIFGTDAEGFIAMNLTRAEIADIVGTGTEPCIRTITKLKKKNLLEIQGKLIKILDERALNSVYEGV